SKSRPKSGTTPRVPCSRTFLKTKNITWTTSKANCMRLKRWACRTTFRSNCTRERKRRINYCTNLLIQELTLHKYLGVLVALFALPLAAQTTTHHAATSTAKKPASPAASHPTAIIDTTAGKLTCTLFPDKAPIGAKNFIGLAKGTKDWTNPATGRKMHGVPLYNGTIFHRVIPEFMIQGGDPLGTGTGDPGYKFKNETSPDLLFDRPGRLAYANAGPNTN